MDNWPAVGSSILERNPQRPRIHAFIWSVYGNVVFITRTYFSAAVCRLCRPISNRKRRSREGSRPAEACPSMRSALSKARQHPQGPASPCCDRTIYVLCGSPFIFGLLSARALFHLLQNR